MNAVLLFKRPEPPKEPRAFDEHVKAAREHVEDKVRAGRELSSDDDFKPLWGDFKDPLAAAQRGKCGFCERDFTTHWGDVEHYRPKNRIEELPEDASQRGEEDIYSGRMTKPRRLRRLCDSGYWWLAYDWSNYLVSCSRCNRSWKRGLFPIAERRVAPPARGDVETPLLLNPFGPEDPVKHLAFTRFGSIEPRDRSALGRATIDTCGLDQPSLARSRAAVANRAYALLEDMLGPTREHRRRALEALLALGADDQIHAGMVRSIVEMEAGYSWNDLLCPKA